MITPIWASELQPPYGFGSQLLVTGNGGAQTGLLLQTVNLDSFLNRGDVAAIELLVKTGAVAPGAAQTLTLNFAWASILGLTIAELAAAKASPQFNLVNTQSVRQIYQVPLQYQLGQYLNFWFDVSGITSGATLELVAKILAKTA